MRSLRPTAAQVQRLALRETDPSRAGAFEPIVAGPVVAILILLAVGIVSVIAVPLAVLARLLRVQR